MDKTKKRLSICVFCGSSVKSNPEFIELGFKTGNLIAQNGHHLIVGGDFLGIMKSTADGARDQKGSVEIICPRMFVEVDELKPFQKKEGEVKGELLTPGKKLEESYTQREMFIITENMQDRKRLMFNHSDVFLTLPGGIGTLDEFFEMLTVSFFANSKKMSILFNYKGYYEDLIKMVAKIVKVGMATEESLKNLRVVTNEEELQNALDEFKAFDQRTP